MGASAQLMIAELWHGMPVEELDGQGHPCHAGVHLYARGPISSATLRRPLGPSLSLWAAGVTAER